MALTRCRECGKKISTEAAACPHCGAPPPLKGDSQPKSPRTGRWRVLLTVFGILVLLWFIGLIARAPHGPVSHPPTKDALPTATSTPPREQKPPEQHRIDLKTAVALTVVAARRLQTPQLALAVWGDPNTIDGMASPTLHYRRVLQEHELLVALIYGPLARGPRRLDGMIVVPHPSPSKGSIREWFGAPARVTNEGSATSWVYQEDRARIGVDKVWFLSDGVVWITFSGSQ